MPNFLLEIMDPLSAAGSIVGLIGVTATTTRILKTFINTVKNAPDLAKNVLAEVTEISACLTQLQAFLLGTKECQGLEHRFSWSSKLLWPWQTVWWYFPSLTKSLICSDQTSHPYQPGRKWSLLYERPKFPVSWRAFGHRRRHWILCSWPSIGKYLLISHKARFHKTDRLHLLVHPRKRLKPRLRA